MARKSIWWLELTIEIAGKLQLRLFSYVDGRFEIREFSVPSSATHEEIMQAAWDELPDPSQACDVLMVPEPRCRLTMMGSN